MKTVWDAVSELKGNLGSLDSISEYLYLTEGWFGCGKRYETLSINNDKYWQLVGTTRDFRALVAEMKTNFGKSTPEDYFTWIALKDNERTATKLEASKMDIEWSEYIIIPPRAVDPREAKTSTSLSGSTLEGADFIINAKGSVKPQPPVYTQEMYDNKIAPVAGMMCEWLHYVSSVMLTFVGDEKFCGKHDSGEEVVGDIRDLNPLPPKQELIDGKAYQFDFNGEKDLMGIYEVIENEFHCIGVSYYADLCTNITLLKPEDKKSSNKGD